MAWKVNYDEQLECDCCVEVCPICGNIMNAGDDICDECLSRDAEGYGTIEQRFGLLDG